MASRLYGVISSIGREEGRIQALSGTVSAGALRAFFACAYRYCVLMASMITVVSPETSFDASVPALGDSYASGNISPLPSVG
jgi:hypothetical protein